MESSDDDEFVPKWVTQYYFVDEKEIPISFSILPICQEEVAKAGVASMRVFLRGIAVSGLKVFMEVISWKLRLQDDEAEISVLRKDNKWTELKKPRNSYMCLIRTTLITIQWLHFLKRTPEASERSLWEHLHKHFSLFEVRPSKSDLKDHVSLIRIFAETDKTLAASKLVSMFLEEKLGRGSGFHKASTRDSIAKEESPGNDNNVVKGIEDVDNDEFEEQLGMFDTVCSICDNGGEILWCEGRCLRSFHATRDAGTDSHCVTLGYTALQVERMQNFLCLNCQYKQHQCFACGKLGSSDEAPGAEVFQCASAICGHFYHPECAARLLFRENKEAANHFQQKVAAGESFICPAHKCFVCKQGENKAVHELQFAICRRCPRSYHRKCLPRNISFEDDLPHGIMQRAWEDLLPSRILIYCLKHEIDRVLATPLRNHITFPRLPGRENINTSPVQKRQGASYKKNKGTSVESHQLIKKVVRTEDSCSGIINTKEQSPILLRIKLSKETPRSDHQNVLLDDKARFQKTIASPPPMNVEEFQSVHPVIDDETMKRIGALVADVSSRVSIEDVRRKQMIPSTYAGHSSLWDKNITLGKVEKSVKAVKSALWKLDENGNTDEAKDRCPPELLNEMPKWKNKLGSYLAPFLHGARYSSYGRHFTKVDKLKEILDKLHWYIEDGDTIVDFCCGSNDFSVLTKEKLDAIGKKCSYKNYDLMQPKNDFNFEKRDWMTVQREELPDGSKLIMGLNPPFGIQASLANMFINKALSFQPKLLILIVPKETQRLDSKRRSYNLIWEDSHKLSGKSFYLPGSVDTEDKQLEQWNIRPPPLYLWSRTDWTMKHKNIALKHGHIFNAKGERRDVELQQTETRRNLETVKGKELSETSDMDLSEDIFDRSQFEAFGTETSHISPATFSTQGFPPFQGGDSYIGWPGSQPQYPLNPLSYAGGRPHTYYNNSYGHGDFASNMQQVYPDGTQNSMGLPFDQRRSPTNSWMFGANMMPQFPQQDQTRPWFR